MNDRFRKAHSSGFFIYEIALSFALLIGVFGYIRAYWNTNAFLCPSYECISACTIPSQRVRYKDNTLQVISIFIPAWYGRHEANE